MYSEESTKYSLMSINAPDGRHSGSTGKYPFFFLCMCEWELLQINAQAAAHTENCNEDHSYNTVDSVHYLKMPKNTETLSLVLPSRVLSSLYSCQAHALQTSDKEKTDLESTSSDQCF